MTMQPIRFNFKARDFWLVWVTLGVYWVAFAVVLLVKGAAMPVV